MEDEDCEERPFFRMLLDENKGQIRLIRLQLTNNLKFKKFFIIHIIVLFKGKDCIVFGAEDSMKIQQRTLEKKHQGYFVI